MLCWTPGLVILLLDGLGCERCNVLQYEKYFLVLAECNALVNPVIYSLRDRDMRSTFRALLCFPCRRGRDPQSGSGVHFKSMEQERSRVAEAMDESNGTLLITGASET